MKTENDWRYFGLVVAGNYVIYPKDFSVVKDIVRISPYMTLCLSFENLFQHYPLGFNVAESQILFQLQKNNPLTAFFVKNATLSSLPE